MIHLENHNLSALKFVSRAAMDFSRLPTIRTLDEPSAPAAPVLVMILPRGPLRGSRLSSRFRRLVNRIRRDLSWMPSVLIALFVAFAVAIPLEVFRQNG